MVSEEPRIQEDDETPVSVNTLGGAQYIYGNEVRLHRAGDHVRVRVGERSVSSQTRRGQALPVPSYEDRASVRMTWNQAKYLMQELAEAIDLHERSNGEVCPSPFNDDSAPASSFRLAAR